MILGLATTDLILYVLLILVIIQIVWVIRLELRIRAFTKGKSGASLEDSMGQLNKLLDRLFSHTEEMGKKIENHDKRLKRSIQGLSTIRFNPFASEGQGSNQSFATAFLNEEGDGVIISSLYSRDKVRVFAKQVKRHSTEHELSEEEKKALDNARVS